MRKRHYLHAADGTWDAVPGRAEAEAVGNIDWAVSADATSIRAHQYATNATRLDRPTRAEIESQESGQRDPHRA